MFTTESALPFLYLLFQLVQKVRFNLKSVLHEIFVKLYVCVQYLPLHQLPVNNGTSLSLQQKQLIVTICLN